MCQAMANWRLRHNVVKKLGVQHFLISCLVYILFQPSFSPKPGFLILGPRVLMLHNELEWPLYAPRFSHAKLQCESA